MRSKRKRFIFRFMLVMVVCLLGVAYVAIFHLDALQKVIRDQIARSFADQLTIQDMHVGFSPYLQLELVDVRLNDPDQGPPIFQASHIRMDLSFFSLVQDALTPHALIIENAHLDLERDERGQWNYQAVFRKSEKERIRVEALLSEYSLELINGSVSIEDRYRRDVPFAVQAEEVELKIDELVLEGPMEVFLSARLSNRGTGSFLSWYGTLENVGGFLNLESLSPLDSAPQLDVGARVELDRHTLLQLAELFDVGEVPVGLQGRTKAQGHIRFAPGVQGYDLVLSELVVLTDMIDLHGEVSVAGLWQPDPPTFSSKWASGPLAIRHLSQLLPGEWIPSGLSDVIHRRNMRGKIQAISAMLSGSARQGLGYSLVGEFQVSEGSVALDPGWGTAEEIQGTVHIEPEQIRLVDFHGRYDHIPITSGNGTIVFNEEGPWFATELAGEVSSRKVLEIIRNLFDWDAPHHPMHPFEGKAGSGLMRIRFAGPLQNPEGVTFQSAEYRPEQATLQLPGLRGLLTHVGGTVTFSPTQVGFENVTGLYRQSDFRIDGKLNFEDRPFVDDMRIQGSVAVTDLLNHFSVTAAPEQYLILGKADYRVLVAGALQTPVIKGGVDLHGLELILPGIMYKPPALAGTLDFTFQVGTNHRLSFQHIALTVPPVRLVGRGSVRYDQAPAIQASLTTDPIDFESLPPGLQLLDERLAAGTLEVSLDLRGTGTDWRSWHKSGWVALTNGVVKIDGMTPPVSHVFLRVKLNGHTAEFKRLQWNIEKSRAQMTGVIRKWDSNPEVTFELTAPQFDLDLLIPKGRRSPLREFLEHIAQTTPVRGNLRFRRAWYKDWHLKGVTGRLQIHDNRIAVDHIQGETANGMIRGRFLVHLPVRRPAAMRTWFDVKNIPLLTLEQTFLNRETLDERLITGTVSAKGLIQGHGKDPRGVLPTLNGNFQLSIRDGRIKRGTVVPKILAIMNLPTLLQGKVDLEKDGYPFDRQTGTFTITNGVIASKDIVLDGPILKMTAAGQYDLANDDLSVVAAASPLGPYFNLLRKISLFEMLLDGEEEGLNLAMFAINGPLRDPSVEPLPLESFQSGLTGFAKLALTVLKNTVSLPQKLFFPDANVESEDSKDDGEEF